jgi:hypothetical protein
MTNAILNQKHHAVKILGYDNVYSGRFQIQDGDETKDILYTLTMTNGTTIEAWNVHMVMVNKDESLSVIDDIFLKEFILQEIRKGY